MFHVFLICQMHHLCVLTLYKNFEKHLKQSNLNIFVKCFHYKSYFCLWFFTYFCHNFFKCLNLWIFYTTLSISSLHMRKAHSKNLPWNYLCAFFLTKFAPNLPWPPNLPRRWCSRSRPWIQLLVLCWSNSSCSAARDAGWSTPSSHQKFTPQKFPPKSPHKGATPWSNLPFPTFALLYC
jgi:hypothetical protein